MSNKITRLSITTAYFSENPTEASASIKLYVFVTEETIEPVSVYYSGEIHSGEV